MEAIPFVLLLVVVVVAGGYALLWVAGRAARRTEAFTDEAHARPEAVLRWEVPPGQDPATVVAALSRHGFEATADTRDDHYQVLVVCPQGRDAVREQVRTVIAGADLNLEGDPAPSAVRFADEH
ncbi:hypothetical protein [Nocardioides sp. SYSU D00038]|uniref:hypothetical protein n=1 Tax=Nocardioides sp. SYSU D00038 TaxID=2812554 RepID=UPI0019677CF3|nr:hypothetical protein [Nocardioides sp. SYSU D00038]